MIGAKKTRFVYNKHKRKTFPSNNRAISPAIATVIMTAAIIVLVLVAMSYAQTYLTSSIAQNDFSTNKQFMLTTGLQIDNVAWMMGRTQTITYSSTYGSLEFLWNKTAQPLSYSMEINKGSGWELVNISLQTGIILFNMPTTEYTLGNNYFDQLSSNGSFLQEGSSAPVSDVYAIEKLPMSDGNFARVAVIPSIRMLNTTVGSQSYVEFYLPLLQNGTNLDLSQSVTLTGQSVTQYVQSGVTQVRFIATFPIASEGFDSGFFPFKNTLENDQYTVTVNLPAPSTVELYVGGVSVSLGLYG
ncbi:MAG: archaellin/type IV pilin N-terminal domain-containing protein [Candidatus Bathyarchaeia archaeon]